jgi:hypothetical protein
VTLVDTMPVEVNTPADLERARRLIAGQSVAHTDAGTAAGD